MEENSISVLDANNDSSIAGPSSAATAAAAESIREGSRKPGKKDAPSMSASLPPESKLRRRHSSKNNSSIESAEDNDVAGGGSRGLLPTEEDGLSIHSPHHSGNDFLSLSASSAARKSQTLSADPRGATELYCHNEHRRSRPSKPKISVAIQTDIIRGLRPPCTGKLGSASGRQRVYPAEVLNVASLPSTFPHQPSPIKVIPPSDAGHSNMGAAPLYPQPGGAEENLLTDGPHAILFRDGKRRIDFMLAWADDLIRKEDKRRCFLEHLKKEGLEVETEHKSHSQDGKTYFAKLYAPWKVLTKYAEFLNMKKPLKMDEIVSRRQSTITWQGQDRRMSTAAWGDIKEPPVTNEVDPDEFQLSDLWCFNCKNPFEMDKSMMPESPNYVNAPFTREKEKHFLINDRDKFFTPAQRSRIVWEILMRTSFDTDERSKSGGVIQLLSDEVYKAAFPLHDGPWGKEAKMTETQNERHVLYLQWARPACWYKKQPLFMIKRYFGEKIGLYFAWLGFYTVMLIPAALLGFFIMLYGVATMKTNTSTREICDPGGSGNLVMCPLCDKKCEYWRLKAACSYSEVVHVVDNPATVFFAAFMSLWATMFMELWKRRQAKLAWEWNLGTFELSQEVVRPEYEAQVFTYRVNPVTLTFEPYLPFWTKIAKFLTANSVVVFMLFVVGSAVFGVIVYRIIVATTLYAIDSDEWRSLTKPITSVTAATLNLIIIMIMDNVYRSLAIKLTDWEQPRTQRAYEDSFTFKMFLFQFINTYSSLIYIAFFKGRFFGHPGDSITLFGFRQDQCDLGGCLYEVCIQLAIIMVGKQILNNIMEFSTSKFYNWWKSWRRGHEDSRTAKTRWEQDYNLQTCGRLALFDEYLEMVIQYGFVTLFVAAFPLAPFFALLNNVVEIRLDAYKYVTQLQRPLAARVPNIGAWQAIIQGLSICAVISNAFMIAYTSDFIPQLVYRYVYSGTGNLDGYINHSMSYFQTDDFPEKSKPDQSTIDNVTVEICRYQDYRQDHLHHKKYNLTMEYWHIFSARLSFVVAFEHLIFFVTGLMAYLIPDIPRSVQMKVQRHRLLAQEALYKAEMNTVSSTVMSNEPTNTHLRTHCEESSTSMSTTEDQSI